MSDLPDRPVAPLSAPPGSFDHVLRRAHARRLRTGLLTATAVLVAAVGSVGAGLALSGDGGRQTLVATQPTSPPATSTPTAGPAPSGAPTSSSRPTPSAGPEASSVPTPGPTSPPPPAGGAVPPTSAPSTGTPSAPTSTTFTGRAVDAAGRPLALLHVTVWSPGNAAPDEHDAYTGADGRFTVPCGTRALLLDWMLGGPQYPSTRNLAATWVGGGSTLAAAPLLPRDGRERVTVLRQGAVLEGAYRGVDGGGTLPLPGTPPVAGLSCPPLGTYDGRPSTEPTCVELTAQGGRYRLVGLPTGTCVLRTARGDTSVRLVEGRTTSHDVDDCGGCAASAPDAAQGRGTADAAPPIR